MLLEVVHAERILERVSFHRRRIVERGPVLRDVERNVAVALPHPQQGVGQSRRIDLPMRLRVRVALLPDRTRPHGRRRGIVFRDAPRVVVDAEKVDLLADRFDLRRGEFGPGLAEDLAASPPDSVRRRPGPDTGGSCRRRRAPWPRGPPASATRDTWAPGSRPARSRACPPRGRRGLPRRAPAEDCAKRSAPRRGSRGRARACRAGTRRRRPPTARSKSSTSPPGRPAHGREPGRIPRTSPRCPDSTSLRDRRAPPAGPSGRASRKARMRRSRRASTRRS